MPDYPTSQVQLIDSRIADAARRPARMGTVQWRSPGDLAGEPGMYAVGVTFDGSSGTAQPVKCFESVLVAEGDKVGVIRYEDDLIITGNYTLRTLGDASYDASFAAGTTTSASFVDMPGSPTAFMPIKYRDATLLRATLHFSLTSTATATVVEFACFIQSSDGSISYDEIIGHRAINEANSHRDLGGWSDTAALPGGQSYAITGRWRRVSGAGTLTTDANDACYIRVQEVVP